MKYKIIKKESKRLKVQRGLNGDALVNVEHSIWYVAKRKGRIFGFWHKVGHEANYDGDLISHTTKTIEALEDYIRKWHEVNYFNKPIEIIKEINI